MIRKPVSRVAILKRINETKQEMGEKEMVRYSCVIMLLFVMGCADSSPDPQEVLEKSRKTTAEIEQKLEAMKKSTQKAIQKVEEMKQKPQAAADLL